MSNLIYAVKKRLGWCLERPRAENLGRLEVMRKAFGVIGGVLLASLLTYLMTSLMYFFPFRLMIIASIGAFTGGFLSRNVKAGFLTGLLSGMLAVPIIARFVIYILPITPYVPEWAAPIGPRPSFSVILTMMYTTYNLVIYILLGLVAGVVGSMGAWIRARKH